MRSVMTAPMSNENEIGNDGADELWVKNENKNDGADDLGGTISVARTRRRDLADASGVGRDLGSRFVGEVEGSSLSLFARLTPKWFEVKFSLQTISGSKPHFTRSTENIFPENLFSMCNQTPVFTEKHFRK